MEISCEIIQDLLPLYLDKKCSAASKFEVEDHVRRCNECKEVVRSLGGDPEDMKNPITAEMLIQALIHLKGFCDHFHSMLKRDYLVCCLSPLSSSFQWRAEHHLHALP